MDNRWLILKHYKNIRILYIDFNPDQLPSNFDFSTKKAMVCHTCSFWWGFLLYLWLYGLFAILPALTIGEYTLKVTTRYNGGAQEPKNGHL